MRGSAVKDYRKHIGREVSVMTYSGSFIGQLVEVGHDTLTIKATAYFFDDGEKGPTPEGLVIIDRYALSFLQVR